MNPIPNAGNQLTNLLHSTNQGASWTALSVPQTTDGGQVNGLNPAKEEEQGEDEAFDIEAGGQGTTHFSILGDQATPGVVYVGGDRQPANATGSQFPNSIGAQTYSGRLFRCGSASCGPITHNGTSNNSAPHADSREMVWDANGDMIETDDGGVYRQTDPATTNGRWEALDGDLQVSEQHSCDYDNVGNIILCGNQDTGAAEQSATGSTSWTELSEGDGGFVAVNDLNAGSSVRYSSSNNLSSGSFQRRTCNAANTCTNSAPGFNVTNSTPPNQNLQTFERNGTGNPTLPLYTPLVLNKVDGNRLVVASSSRLYESTDQLDNLAIINGALPGSVTRAVAYGGRQSGANNPAVLWYGTNNGQLFLRSAGGGGGVALPGWTFGNPLDIVLDPENWAVAYVTNGTAVYRTSDAGGTFTNITGNLAAASASSQLWSLEIVPVGATGQLALLAGTSTGVFASQTQNLGVWAEIGNLPNTHAYDLRYDATDNVLLVGTLGRGSWLLQNANQLVPVANLRVTKTDTPDPVMAGQELFYTVTVTNDGPGTAIAPVVVDDLPAEVVYLSDNGGCTYDALAHRLTCALSDIPNGQSRSFTIKTRVKSDAVVGEDDGTALIQNRVSVGGVSVDADTSDNTFTDPTFVQDSADLKVTKLCKPDGPLPAGQVGTCTIYVDNLGPSSARDVELRDANVSNGAFTFDTITPSQGTCDPPSNGVVICRLGDLAAASTTASGRATVTVQVTANEQQDINDVATATAATPDPVTSNNQAQGAVHVTAVADLSITKTGPATATAGTDITYNLSVANGGPSTAQAVVVNDDLSAGVDILSVSASGGASCSAGVPGDSSRPSTCSFGNLAPGATRTMTITVRIRPEVVATIQNDARVSSATFDPNTANNLANASTTVTGSADLSITKSGSPNPVTAGNNLTYTLKVTNGGPSTAVAVVVTDTLPTGTTFVSGVDGNGNGYCALVQPGSVSCDLGTMAPGASKTIFLTVKVASAVPSGANLHNVAAVGSSTSDPNGANNTATADTGVVTSADVWVDKQATNRSGNPSPIVTYTIVVHNNNGCETDAQSTTTPNCGTGGPSDAVNLVITDKLPLDAKKLVVQYVSPQCTYDKATHTVTCPVSRLPAGSSVTFVVEAQVSGSVGTIANTASITSSGTPDPVAGNNSNTATLVMKGGTGKK